MPAAIIVGKTAKGLRAAAEKPTLSPDALRVLAAVDGRSSLDSLHKRCGMVQAEFEAAIAELRAGELVQEIGQPAVLAPGPVAEDEEGPPITLDFTRAGAAQQQHQAAALAKARADQREQASRLKEAEESHRAAAQREREQQEARQAQAKLETEARSMLVAALRPKVEEALRVKLAAVLKPRIEETLRKELAAVLRPRIEAELRAEMAATLAPRIELELRTRFARQLVHEKAQAGPAALAAVPEPAVTAAAPPEPDAEDTVVGEVLRMLDSMGDVVFATNVLGVLEFVSPAWSQLTGHEADGCSGKSLATFFEPHDQPAVEDFLGRIALGTAIRSSQEGVLAHKSGRTVWVELCATPRADAAGEPIGACGVIRETGAARLVAQDLENTSLKLLLLVDTAGEAVVIEDRNGAIQQVNPAFCTLFSVQAAPFSLEGSATEDLLRDIAPVFADAAALAGRMAQIREAGEDVDGDEVGLRDGRVVRLSYRAVAEGGPASGHLWLFRAPEAMT